MAVTPLQNILPAKAYQNHLAGKLVVIAVCKNQPDEKIRAAVSAGYRHFGENTLQGLTRTATLLSSVPEKTALHFVGRLQSNKLKKICSLRPAMIHSAAQVSHLNQLNHLSTAGTPLPELLLQINVAANPHQEGIATDLQWIAQLLSQFSQLPIVGLMALGPNPDRFTQTQAWQEATQQSFQALATLRQSLCQQGFTHLQKLSMGMSSDYPWAIAAGATHLRLGTCVFGDRTR